MTLISIIILSIILEAHTAALNSENVNVHGAQMVDEGYIGSLSRPQDAFETIANVNSENGMLMPPNADSKSYGLLEYDIQLEDRSHAVVFGQGRRKKRGATASLNQLWPDGKVYYTLHSSIANESPAYTDRAIQEAMDEYHQKTCIKFIPRTTQTHYIEFHKGSGCWSMIGRVGGKQQISLGYGCEQKGVVIHEMLHALGFWHEQSRPDRDQYVTILFDNVKDGMETQFKKYDRGEIDSLNSPYDYLSIMHYGDRSFSKDPARLRTIQVKDPNLQGTIGQRLGLSTADLQQLKQLYKCNSVGVTVDGGWGAFSAWSACDKSCGGGQQRRSRSCNNPSPSNGGKPCVGNSVETRGCNTNQCSTTDKCTFEVTLCSWINGDSSEIKWQRVSGKTPSPNTGPKFGNGVYLYMEASGYAAGNRAHLLSGPIDSSDKTRCFKFSYHMYGSTIGQLNVYYVRSGASKLVWSLKRNQGDGWQNGRVPITTDYNNFKILIEGIRGASYTGDIAIDDLEISQEPCTVNPPSAAVETKPPQPTAVSGMNCDFESSSPDCSWGNIDAQDTLNWRTGFQKTDSTGTGPNDGSTFIYIEASRPAMKDDNAWLASPVIPAVSTTDPKCFQFQYFMYGAAMGSLNILIYKDGSFKKVWSLSGNQGEVWRTGAVPLPTGVNQRIVIEGVVGPGWSSDIAIDELVVLNSACKIQPSNAVVDTPVVPPTTPPTVPSGAILVEVSSEGCFDPPVRKRTQDASLQTQKRKRRGLGDFLRKAKEKAKNIVKKLKEKAKKKFQENVNSKKVQIFAGILRKLLSQNNPKISKVTTTSRNPVTTYDCTLARGSIKVNGVEYSLLKPGHNVVVVDAKTGGVTYRKNYDTSRNPSLWSTVNNDLQRTPEDSIIAVAVQGSSIPQYVSKNQLNSIGAVPPFLPSENGSWAFVGYKGNYAVDWIKQETKLKGSGPSNVASVIPLIKTTGTGTGGGGTVTKSITTITLQKSETVFDGRSYMPLPLTWSNRLDFGIPEYTMSLWFKTNRGGTLFSKAHPSLTSYDDNIKTVYIEDGKVNVKLAKGSPYVMSLGVSNDVWHHLVLVMKQTRILGYIDEKIYLDRSITVTPDDPAALVNIGKTVDNYPSLTIFTGTMKNIIYKNTALSATEISSL